MIEESRITQWDCNSTTRLLPSPIFALFYWYYTYEISFGIVEYECLRRYHAICLVVLRLKMKWLSQTVSRSSPERRRSMTMPTFDPISINSQNFLRLSLFCSFLPRQPMSLLLAKYQQYLSKISSQPNVDGWCSLLTLKFFTVRFYSTIFQCERVLYQIR